MDDEKNTIDALEEMYESVNEETAYNIKKAIEEARGPIKLMDRFRRALMLADFDFHIHDEEKGESWKGADLSYLLTQLMVHAKKIGAPYGSCVVNTKSGHIHAIKVVNYALMIATRIMEADSPPLSNIELEDIKLAEEERAKGKTPVFDSVEELMDSIGKTPEAEWKGQNITLVSAYSGVTRLKPNENIIEKEPLETESEDEKE